MNNRKSKISQMPIYCLLAIISALLIASLFTCCSIYQREEVEIIRCPIIDADTVQIPDWEIQN